MTLAIPSASDPAVDRAPVSKSLTGSASAGVEPLPLCPQPDPLALLARRAREGDDTAFAELVGATSDRLFNYLFRLTAQAQDAEDLAQETYLKAHRALDRYDPRRPFLPWLFTIARRTALNHRRSWHPTEPLPEEAPAAASADPARTLVGRDEWAHLWRVAQTLPPRYHEALWLYYGEGFDTAQVAAVLRTRPLVVKVVLHRARRALLTALRRQEPSPPPLP